MDDSNFTTVTQVYNSVREDGINVIKEECTPHEMVRTNLTTGLVEIFVR